jgi:hypothetical protein
VYGNLVPAIGMYDQFSALSTAMPAHMYLKGLDTVNSISTVGILVKVTIGNGTGLRDLVRSPCSTQI